MNLKPIARDDLQRHNTLPSQSTMIISIRVAEQCAALRPGPPQCCSPAFCPSAAVAAALCFRPLSPRPSHARGVARRASWALRAGWARTLASSGSGWCMQASQEGPIAFDIWARLYLGWSWPSASHVGSQHGTLSLVAVAPAALQDFASKKCSAQRKYTEHSQRDAASAI